MVPVRLWDRLMDWDRRTSRRLGLRFDDPKKSPEENIKLAQRRRRFWLRPPIVVDEADYMTTDEAKAALRSRAAPSPNINLLVARGILQPCFVADGRQGVTRSSVFAEVQWRRTASRWRKVITRFVGGIFYWI